MTNIIPGLLLSLASPILLIPVEKLLPYPYFVEELVKLAVVLMVVKEERTAKKSLLIWVLIAGLLFTLSESILYLVNIFAIGDLSLFPRRLLFTGLLHTSTIALMYLMGRKSNFWLTIGFILASFIHFSFNFLVAR